MHRSALVAVCETPERLAVGPKYPLDCLPPDLPTKNRLCPVLPATSRYGRSTIGPVLGLKLVSLPSAHSVLIALRCVSFLLPSRKRVAFQVFLTCSRMDSFRYSAVSCSETVWSIMARLFLDFHIVHIDMEIRIRSCRSLCMGLFRTSWLPCPLPDLLISAIYF